MRACPIRFAPAWLAICVGGFGLAMPATDLHAEDWPTYAHDVSRSAVSHEEIRPPLAEAWAIHSAVPPQPAWPAPAKWDGYNKVYDLKNRMVFDRALHVAAVGDAVYFGSSVDDQVYCLDADSGTVRWRFYTEGPIRLAPTVAEGRVYVGSDDGYVYCLEADTGDLVWKHRLGPDGRRLPGNGRLVSPWAVRTGVVVVDGVAYCGAGVMPFEGVFLAALDAKTGQEVWKTEVRNLTAQGYLLASPKLLFLATGRDSPVAFERATGKRLYQVGGGGGTYALLVGDQIVYGPGKTGELLAFAPGTSDRLASFQGNHMIVTPTRSYLHTDTQLSALDRVLFLDRQKRQKSLQSEKDRLVERRKGLAEADAEALARIDRELERVIRELDQVTQELPDSFAWRVDCDHPLALIRVGSMLYAGGDGSVMGIDAESGETVWQTAVDGPAYGLAAANGRLFVSTETGTIHCFRQGEPSAVAVASRDAARPPVSAEANSIANPPTVSQTASPSDDALFRWVFDSGHVRDRTVTPLRGDRSLIADRELTLVPEGRQAILLDGKQYGLRLSDGLDRLAGQLPTDALSVEAWAVVRKPLRWGGLLGAIQDNGSYERGFLLGFCNDRFAFGISSEGKQRLTYLQAKTPLGFSRWHHVVGTYDGREQRLYIDGKLAATSDEPSGPVLPAPKGFFEVGSYHDDDEFYRTTGMLHEVALYDRVLTPAEIEGRFETKAGSLPAVPSQSGSDTGPVVHGPFAEFVRHDTLRIQWVTEAAQPSWLEVGPAGGAMQRLEDPSPKTEHSFEVSPVVANTMYRYRVGLRTEVGGLATTPVYEFDSGLNYEPIPVGPAVSPYADLAGYEHVAAFVDRLKAELAGDRGYCLVRNAVDGRLAQAIAERTNLRVVAQASDAARAGRCRELLTRGGRYGTQIVVHETAGDELPYSAFVFDLIVDEGLLLGEGDVPADPESLFRRLSPWDGVLVLARLAPGAAETWQRSTFDAWKPLEEQAASVAFRTDDAGAYYVLKRAALPGAQDWTHQYGLPDNSSCNQDELIHGELTVAWWGRPGPRPMPDRGNRNPAPVAAGGRLYIQGNRTLFAVDAYDGTVLWAKQIPTMRRANLPRDCSNMVATPTHLYVALQDRCVAFDGETGELDLRFRVDQPQFDQPEAGAKEDEPTSFAWGYLAVTDGILLGSSVRQGAQYLGDDGEWYEDYGPHNAGRVTSAELFARDALTGSTRWNYVGGAVLNSTITSAQGKVFFLESRHPEALASPGGNLLDEAQRETVLVALDLETGRKLWEQPFDSGKLQFMTYLSHGDDTLVVTGTDIQKVFHTHAFDAKTGKPLWDHHDAARKKHHSGHLMHPVVLGDRLHHNKHLFDLRSGEVLRTESFDYHGCGVMSASANAIFHRFEYHGLWDLETDTRTEFFGVRGGCWLGQVPAGGMLLAPESGAGCSCTHALQTSMAFIPQRLLSQTPEPTP